MNQLQILKGKRLLRVSTGKASEIPKGSTAYGGVHDQNRDTVTFHCEDGDYVYLADGECCSQTYINSVDGPQRGLIQEVQEPEWSEPVRETKTDDYEVTKFYKVTLAIEGQGHLDIEYRNESNGYYGGSLELLAAPSESADRKEEEP